MCLLVKPFICMLTGEMCDVCAIGLREIIILHGPKRYTHLTKKGITTTPPLIMAPILNLYEFPVWDSIDKKRSPSTLPFFSSRPTFLKLPAKHFEIFFC